MVSRDFDLGNGERMSVSELRRQAEALNTYEAAQKAVGAVMAGKRNTPSTQREPGMALSRAEFMVRCLKLHGQAKCERIWAGRHGDGPS